MQRLITADSSGPGAQNEWLMCKDCCGKDWAGGISGERSRRSAGKEGKYAKAERVGARHHPERYCVCLSVRILSTGAEAPIHEAPGCGERGEGLQGGLHCLSWERGQGRSDGEHGVSAAGYVSGFYGLRGDDARAGRQLEGGDCAWR